MKLPRLSGSRPTEDILISFKGYNCTEQAGKGEFADMENMTGERFPLLSPRRARGTVRTLEKANGLMAREKLFWVDGTAVFYGGEKIGEVADSEKQLISMGAYVLIFPDKKYYNTADGSFGEIENRVTVQAASWKQTYLTETEQDGEGQVYIQISSAGINEGFQKGDGVEISGCREDALNGTHVIQDIGEGWIKIIAAIEKDGSQEAALTIERKLPDMDFLTVAENRLWGCSSKAHEIYASKIGDFKNFYCFEGTAADSYAATIANDGDFTGAITYLGYVLFFKENSVHKVYGSKPSNFQIVEGQLRGVERGSSRSLQIVNEVLYYKANSGIMSFQGSMPYEVGAALGSGYEAAWAGTAENKYYISMKKDGVSHLFVYDTAKGLWHREDSTEARFFTKDGSTLYYLDGNVIKTISGKDTDVIDWYAETTDFTYQTADSKFISRVSLRCEVESGAALEVWIDYDSRGAWRRLKSIGSGRKGIINVPLIPTRCDHFRLRFSGYGVAAIHDMTLFLATGSNERR